MIISPSFALLEELLGSRTDDPRLAELHRAHGLRPPPLFPARDGWDGMGVPEQGWEMAYKATVRIPGRYPSPRVRGRGPVIGYVTKVYITESYPAPVRDGLTVALPEPEARARALDSMVAEYGNVVHVLHRDDESTFEVRYHEDGRFIWFLLTLNERAENDPELLGVVTPDARTIPLWPTPEPDEPVPAALRALKAHQDASGLDGLDFETFDRFEPDAIASWTGSDDADREFRTFGRDGSGGRVAFWRVHEGLPIEQQPVVLFGGEGDIGPVAKDLCDLLYLLAAGVGPFEAAMAFTSGEDIDDEATGPRPEIARIAETHLQRREGRTPQTVIEDAENEYADVRDRVDALTR
ncbi:hypothetical protein AB0C84_03360 [Actinomadura sp. NPDC048955]|uniref:hypothetical protein n=1 Tax=Actinomadura sp. NPDC048955 TaxID=3158228 RepID=UPI003411F53C